MTDPISNFAAQISFEREGVSNRMHAYDASSALEQALAVALEVDGVEQALEQVLSLVQKHQRSIVKPRRQPGEVVTVEDEPATRYVIDSEDGQTFSCPHCLSNSACREWPTLQALDEQGNRTDEYRYHVSECRMSSASDEPAERPSLARLQAEHEQLRRQSFGVEAEMALISGLKLSPEQKEALKIRSIERLWQKTVEAHRNGTLKKITPAGSGIPVSKLRVAAKDQSATPQGTQDGMAPHACLAPTDAEFERWLDEAIAANPDAVAAVMANDDRPIRTALTLHVLKASRGKANPAIVEQHLVHKLNALKEQFANGNA